MLAKLSQSLSSLMRLVTWSYQAIVESFSLFRFSFFFGLDVNFGQSLNAFLGKKEIFVNLQNNDGKTALICAAEYGHTEALNFLLEKTDRKGFEPFSSLSPYEGEGKRRDLS